jgi:glycolate oxidase iron-sulfur subunit
VQYGELVETARVVIESNRTPGIAERFLRWLGTRQLMPNLRLLRLAARWMWLYERSGLQRLVRAMNVLPKTLKAMEAILPPIHLEFTRMGHTFRAQGARQGRVLFFTGCIQEGFLSPVNQATLRVLQRNGYDVFTPAKQTCCGAASLHLGEVEAARELARRNIDTFLDHQPEFQAVICNAGGCGVSLKEYPHLLGGDPVYAARARAFSEQVKDVNEFLAEHMAAPPRGYVNARATYADSCHLRHGQKVARQPRDLLKQVPGLELVELSQPDRCCGSAGVYNITQAETAQLVLDAKMADIAATGAELIVTSNTGCHMQLLAGVRQAGLNARVMHVVEVLDLSYRSETP